MTAYDHTQRSPVCWLPYTVALGLLVGSFFVEGPAEIALIAVGIIAAVIGASFHCLTVRDLGDVLLVRFGPLPFFQRTISYADIESVQTARSLIADGWGIHYSLRGGWIWNIWGRGCVALQLRHGKMQIGTDDAVNLCRFLKGRIGQPAT